MFNEHSTKRYPPQFIRPFQPRDQTAVQQLILNGLKQRFGRLDPRFNQDVNDITTHYIDQGTTFLVLIQHDKIIGCGALTLEPNTPHTGRIERVSIAPNFQGKGLGTDITKALINHGRQRQLNTLLVETNDDWHSAIHLYQKLGFIPYKHENGEIHMRFELIVSNTQS